MFASVVTVIMSRSMNGGVCPPCAEGNTIVGYHFSHTVEVWTLVVIIIALNIVYGLQLSLVWCSVINASHRDIWAPILLFGSIKSIDRHTVWFISAWSRMRCACPSQRRLPNNYMRMCLFCPMLNAQRLCDSVRQQTHTHTTYAYTTQRQRHEGLSHISAYSRSDSVASTPSLEVVIPVPIWACFLWCWLIVMC